MDSGRLQFYCSWTLCTDVRIAVAGVCGAIVSLTLPGIVLCRPPEDIRINTVHGTTCLPYGIRIGIRVWYCLETNGEEERNEEEEKKGERAREAALPARDTWQF